MSDEQQQAAIGRTVDQYITCKKTLATLFAEAIKVGNELSSIGQALRSAQSSRSYPQFSGPIFTLIQALPDTDRLRKLAEDINNETDRKRQLFSTLREMGFEPKD